MKGGRDERKEREKCFRRSVGKFAASREPPRDGRRYCTRSNFGREREKEREREREDERARNSSDEEPLRVSIDGEIERRLNSANAASKYRTAAPLARFAR